MTFPIEIRINDCMPVKCALFLVHFFKGIFYSVCLFVTLPFLSFREVCSHEGRHQFIYYAFNFDAMKMYSIDSLYKNDYRFKKLILSFL